MNGLSEFEKYQKRALRMKALEEVLTKAKTFYALPKGSVTSSYLLILAELKLAIEKADATESPHISSKE